MIDFEIHDIHQSNDMDNFQDEKKRLQRLGF